jgi:uncharacterized membrane protein YgcG
MLAMRNPMPKPFPTAWLACRGLAIALLLAFTIRPAAAEWHVADFQATVAVDRAGSIAVTERIAVKFTGPYHGIYRTIPVDYPGPDGSNYHLYLKLQSVTDGAGEPLRYESSRQGAFQKLKIFIPDAVDAERVVMISYTIPNATRFFDGYAEFYWNVTGNDWPVAIDHASAHVSLPPGATGLRAQAFSGEFGAKGQDATANATGAGAVFATTRRLDPRSGLTIDIYIPNGILEKPTSLTKALWFLGANPGVFMPVWALLVMIAIWFLWGRAPSPGISVAPMYAPPNGFTPAETGALMKDKVLTAHIGATMIDLAVRGFLKIRQTTEKVLVFNRKDYELQLLKSDPEWNALALYEVTVLRNVFLAPDAGAVVNLSALRNRFYTAIPEFRRFVLASLRAKNMYRMDPATMRAFGFLGAAATAAPFIAGTALGWFSLAGGLLITAASILVSVLIVILFSVFFSARTLEGARTAIEIEGFKEFMNRVDADRLKRMPMDTFEKFLPYAMALGVEHRWAKAFEGIAQTPPDWYAGATPYAVFSPVLFANDIHSMSSDMHSTFASAPQGSSSGSGFGGGGDGGSSGGGFGGGGGDAF